MRVVPCAESPIPSIDLNGAKAALAEGTTLGGSMKPAWLVVVAVAMTMWLPSLAQADGNNDETAQPKKASDGVRYEQLVEELKEQRALLEAQSAEIEGLRASVSQKPSLNLHGTEITPEMQAGGQAPPPKPALAEQVKSKWGMNVYGFVEADFIHDNRQSANLTDGAFNPVLPTPRTYATTHGQTTFGLRNSRLGFNISAPEYEGIRVSGKLEGDFEGTNGGATIESNATWTNPTYRIRHAYLVMDTDYVTFTFGQTWELFGWQPYFHPNTVDIQGVPGQVYSRSPKAQLSHKFKGPVDIELGLAASRPPERDAEGPDLQAGVKLTIPEWVGVHTIGATGTAIDAAGLGISGTTREWRIPTAGTNSDATRGSAAALDLFLPILHPDKESRGNSLSLTGEVVIGRGLNDLYSGFNAGVGAVAGVADAGAIQTLNGDLKAVPWRTEIIGMQYYLPGDGTWWVSANYSSGHSHDMYQFAGTAVAFHSFSWINADVFWDVTPAVRLGLSVDQYKDYFNPALGTTNTGLDTRIQFSVFLIF